MKNKKNKLGLGILIGILIGLIVGLSGYIICDKFIDNNKDKQEVKNDNNKQNDIKEDEILTLTLDDDTGKSLYQSITLPICSSYNNYYYRDDTTLINDISQNVKMYLTAKNSSGSLDSSSGMHISTLNFEKSFHKLFGENSNYQFIETNDIAVIKKEDNDSILYYYADTCLPTLYRNIIKIEKNNTKNEYYIYEKIAFLKLLESNDESNEYVDVYSDYQYKTLLKSNTSAKYLNGDLISVDISSDSLDTYKYTFKQNSGVYENDYYLYSVERK